MDCWYHACKNQTGCLPAAFNCSNADIPSRNLTFVDDFCPINPPNATVFDFGIFLGALQSGITASTDFPKKLLLCFGWSLRNLSSFGSNLQTSSNPWETTFANFISVLGLLLFLFLIGHVQLYMQFAAEKSERKSERERRERQEKNETAVRDLLVYCYEDKSVEDWLTKYNIDVSRRHEVKDILCESMVEAYENRNMDFRDLKMQLQQYLPKHDNLNNNAALKSILNQARSQIIASRKGKTDTKAEIWMKKNKIPELMHWNINRYVKYRIENSKKDINVVNLLSVLPPRLNISIKSHLCLDILKKAPTLQNANDSVVQEIVRCLHPVMYEKRSFVIREGEPLDFVLLVTQGIAWQFKSSPSLGGTCANTVTEHGKRYLERGNIFGEELLEIVTGQRDWLNVPTSTKNVIAQMTTIEGFYLSADILNKLYHKFRSEHPQLFSQSRDGA